MTLLNPWFFKALPLLGLPTALLLGTSVAGAGTRRPPVSVPLCRGITLSASYLSEAGAGEGPGFQFLLENYSDKEIRLIEPVPSSSHWYALVQGRWLWRASNGAGGSLLDALNERGRLFVYQLPDLGVSRASFTVQPHQSRKWVESARENPVLEYKPGCPICSYPGEREYRVVFAYAFLPGNALGRHSAGSETGGLLTCGLRSKAVPMPPKSPRLPAGDRAR